MNTRSSKHALVLTAIVGFGLAGCGTSGGGTGGASGSAGTAGDAANAGAGGSNGTNGGTGPAGTGGTTAPSGGASGASTGGAGASTGGASTGGSAGATGGTGGGSTLCTVGAWPMADPAVAGPFATVTENNVGPAAGQGADGGAPVAFTMFRPMDLAQGGLCHPVVTWGNGTGSSPSLYRVFLNHLASHGFVVIASNSPQVAQGDPPPMVAGVTWVLEQNDDPTSVLYQRIDTTHVGATGHSQGGFATTTAAGDSHITTMAPLCGASPQRNLHGPGWFFCGGMDTTVPCSNVQRGFDAVTDQPAMFANHLSSDHANWVTFRGTTPSPVEIAATAWMRVHLMGDTSLRSWFYGPSCRLCTDAAWEITQKMMDQ